MIKLIFTFYLLDCPSASAQILKYPNLSQEGLDQVASFAKTILRNCAPPSCLPVFLGRSNILYSAYIEAFELSRSVTLPITGASKISAGDLSVAEANFRHLVLEPFLTANSLEGVTKLNVVDFVNESGLGFARVSSWIQRFVTDFDPNIKVGVLEYGKFMSSEASSILETRRISRQKISYMSLQDKVGDLAPFNLNSSADNYAPFKEFNSVTATEGPNFEADLRRTYIYYENNGQNPTHYASYNDLVQWFRNPKLRESLPSRSMLNPNISGACNTFFSN